MNILVFANITYHGFDFKKTLFFYHLYFSAKNESQILIQFSSSCPIQDNALKIIGFTKDEFLYLTYFVVDKMNHSSKRTKEQALFVYFFWLRTGLTLEVFNLIYQIIIF